MLTDPVILPPADGTFVNVMTSVEVTEGWPVTLYVPSNKGASLFHALKNFRSKLPAGSPEISHAIEEDVAEFK